MIFFKLNIVLSKKQLIGQRRKTNEKKAYTQSPQGRKFHNLA